MAPSGNPDGQRPVGKVPTGDEIEEAAAALWQPAGRAEELFAELLAAVGKAAMANYGDFWLARCRDSRRAVIETLAQNKLARHDPRHKPWAGGTWKKNFQRRLAELHRAGEAVR